MNWCIVYLDNIIIFSQDAASHIEQLEAVFQKLAKDGLKLKPSKCEFFKKRIKYLGPIVSKEVFQLTPRKWKQSFIGLSQRQFIISGPC